MRDDAYTPFDPPSEPLRPADVIVFVMARTRGDLTDSMRGSLRTGLHGWEAVYVLNGEIYQSQWFASEALARTDLAAHQDTLAAAGWIAVPFQP
jgi:hypothetical protein